MIYVSKLIGSVWMASIVGTLCAAASAGADWPQFQGPNRTGISQETGIARAWPEGGPRVVWTTSLAEGFAGPAIRDGEVYLLDRVDSKQDVLRCFDLATGRELWTFAYDAPGEKVDPSVPAVLLKTSQLRSRLTANSCNPAPRYVSYQSLRPSSCVRQSPHQIGIGQVAFAVPFQEVDF